MVQTKHLFAAALAAVIGTTMPVGTAHAGSQGFSVIQQDAREVTVTVANIADMDERGVEGNVILNVFVGAGAYVYSLKWDINLTSHPGSYLSEMQLTFSDTAGNGVTFTPGGGDDFDGTRDYAGFQDLRPAGQAFHVGSDGLLRLEFHDAYKDLAFDEPEGVWNSGTLIFGVSAVPEPATYALMAGGLLMTLAATRRRSRTTRCDRLARP
jgi:hypothetical protein